MEWPRVKTILIVALIALNGFLAFHLYGQPILPPLRPAYLAAASEDQVIHELSAYNLTAELPDAWPDRLPPVILTPRLPAFNPMTLLTEGLDETKLDAPADGQTAHSEPVGAPTTVGHCEGELFTNKSQRLFTTADGCLIYVQTGGHETRARPADIATATSHVRDFLQGLETLPPDLEGPVIEYDAPSGLVNYRYQQIIPETSARLVLFDGFVEVRVAETGVTAYQRQIWDVLASEPEPQPVMPITTILLRELSSGSGGSLRSLLDAGAVAAGDAVTAGTLQAELGYALRERVSPPAIPADNDGEQTAFRAVPAWRVSLNGVGAAQFDARTGEPLTP